MIRRSDVEGRYTVEVDVVRFDDSDWASIVVSTVICLLTDEH